MSCLVDGNFDEQSVDHLRMLVRNHWRELTKDVRAEFREFFKAFDKFFRPDRLKRNSSDLDTKISATSCRLKQETESERKMLAARRD